MKFSVIIPAYNAEKTIARSINSVISQTFDEFELIIVDDGSRDKTKDIVAQFSDDRIKYIFRPNQGVSSARNTGIISSSGKYVCFLDSDDEWKENHLEELSKLIEKYTDCGLYVTGYDIRLTDGKILHRSTQVLKNLESGRFDNGYEILLNYGYFLHTDSICCKREVFDRVGNFEVGVKNGEDDDMWFRIFAYYPIAITKTVTAVYDRSESAATAKRVPPQESVFSKRVETLLHSPEVTKYRKDSLLIWRERNKLSLARKYILSGNKREARKIIKTIEKSKVNKRKYLETIIALLVPAKITKAVIDKRDKSYYR